MQDKLKDMLERGGGTHTLKDILAAIERGKMQSHVFGDTWLVTEIQDFPQKTNVHINFCVGNLDDVIKFGEPGVTEWAKEINADMMTMVCRVGHMRNPMPDWRLVGLHSMKELK